MKRGIATMTLDYGKVPPWLFERMVHLSKNISIALIDEHGPDEFIKRLADPVWFQALSCVIGMDWNSSGTTVITTGALKAGLRGLEKDLGIFICGGKGATSRKTPAEIQSWGQRLNLSLSTTNSLVHTSKMTAKVDSSLVQDNYQLYHHAFFFTLRRSSGQAKLGSWAVVQQGMNEVSQTARRYHWSNALDLINEPHAGISSQALHPVVLNLVSKKSGKTRDISTELAQASYNSLMKDIEILRRHSSKLSRMIALKTNNQQLTLLELAPVEFHYHPVVNEDFSKSKYLEKVLQKVTYYKPKDYQSFLTIEGVGPKTVRALSLVSEIIYGAKPSYEDPARYSFAHGGKDATPYPVDRATFDQTIAILEQAVGKTRLNPWEKDKAIARLNFCKRKDLDHKLGMGQAA